jgi:hypothetical protein
MTCPLFVELCAGTAAVSLRLHRDGARPPVSRMGSKAGYADTILRVLGLVPGQRAAAYLWCEPDPGVRLLLEAYRDGALAKAAAAIIRSWAGEDPRALWERLRAEGPPRCPDGGVEAGEVARWLNVEAWANGGRYMGPDRPSARREVEPDWTASITAAGLASRADTLPTLPAAIAPDARQVDPREVARVLQIIASNELINVAWSDVHNAWRNTGIGGTTFGGPIGYGGDRVPGKLEALPVPLPALIHPDARQVDPREVARWGLLGAWSFRKGEPESGFNPGAVFARPATATDHGSNGRTVGLEADMWERLPQVEEAGIHPDARAVDPGPALPPGTVAYLDGPYENTTQYANLLPRSEQVALARRWAAAGATVCISEAEAIPELVAEGWWQVRIDGERVGQRRTFSRQQAEWLTLNRAPAWRPSVQGGLFTPR